MIKILVADQVPLSEILARPEEKRDISGAVANIIEDVRQNGDAALRRYTKEFDKAEPDSLEVPQEQIDRARGPGTRPAGRAGGGGGEHPRLPPAAGAKWVRHQ